MFFVRSIILLFLIGFSFSVYSQNTDVGGIYIGEQHGNPVNAQIVNGNPIDGWSWGQITLNVANFIDVDILHIGAYSYVCMCGE